MNSGIATNNLKSINKSNTKKGILLVNLGTPKSPEPKDIRVYLDEFLSDPRVIDINPIARFFLLKFIILPTRPKRVSKSYKEIWLENGSPLLIYSKEVKEKLQKKLGDEYHVELAMRYGEPSLDKALEVFKNNKYDYIKIIPLFPQYASASTASVIEKIMNITKNWHNIPSLDIKSYFYNDENYIHANVEVAKKYLKKSYDHILFSFDGIPERHIKNGDESNHCQFNSCCETINEKNQFCYRAQCFQTAYQIADKLNLKKEDFTICFQSRLGRTPWIKPYTDHILKDIMANKGYKKLLVFAPSFVSDCLETVFEISIEYDLLFKSYGGEKVQLIESLNNHDVWVQALEKIILEKNSI